MNKARDGPQKYAELYIKPKLQYNLGRPFGANSYLAPGGTVYTMTNEGKNGIQSCINDLSRRQGMSPLFPAEGLFRAAKDHVNDTGPKGIYRTYWKRWKFNGTTNRPLWEMGRGCW